jgi:hypothetical protein
MIDLVFNKKAGPLLTLPLIVRDGYFLDGDDFFWVKWFCHSNPSKRTFILPANL